MISRAMEGHDVQRGTRVLRENMPSSVVTVRERALGSERQCCIQSLSAVVKQIEGPDIERPTSEIEAGGG